jgi:tetratricopeptide (TPR) repeat protein
MEGNPHTWPERSQKAHAFAWRAVGLRYLEVRQYDQGWHYLNAACEAWPTILDRLDTFYELACFNQPAGHRGHTAGLDIKGNGEIMLEGLDGIFADATSELASMRDLAYGNAHLTLALLCDQANLWSEGRRYLLQAIRYNKRLLQSPLVLRRGLKLWLKPGLTRMGHTLRGETGDYR